MRRIYTTLLAVVLATTACGSRGGGSDLPRRVPPNALALYAIVETLDKNGAPSKRPIHVIIDAFDNNNHTGQWVDTDSNQSKPYPKNTTETSRYQHPIYYDPRLIITASITAFCLCPLGETLICYFVGPGGLEVPGSSDDRTVRVLGTNKLGEVTVHCAANTTGLGS